MSIEEPFLLAPWKLEPFLLPSQRKTLAEFRRGNRLEGKNLQEIMLSQSPSNSEIISSSTFIVIATDNRVRTCYIKHMNVLFRGKYSLLHLHEF